jgi:hypothetical protein
MDKVEKVEFEVLISVPDTTDEELDRLTRQLLAEIKETDIESAQLGKSGSIPDGAKGDPITIGTILLAAIPAAMPKVIDLIQAWSMRGSNRTVKFKGMGIEFEGSPEELNKLLAKLEKGKKKK